MASHIVHAALRETAYQLPEEDRQAILAHTDLSRTMQEIEQQRQQFIEMYGDPFAPDAG